MNKYESLKRIARLHPGLPSPAARHAGGFAMSDPAVDPGFAHELEAGRLHEFVAEQAGDAGCVGFALLLAQRASPDRPLLWMRDDQGERESGRGHAPGIADLGIDPARIVLVCARDVAGLLKAVHDAAQCDGVGAIVAEIWGHPAALDLTALRRLVLAAERSGVTVLLARPTDRPGPSAARTRWRIAATPSTPGEGDAPGHPAFAVALERDRGGCPPFSLRLEWDRDRLSFRAAPLSGGVAAVPAERADRRAA